LGVLDAAPLICSPGDGCALVVVVSVARADGVLVLAWPAHQIQQQAGRRRRPGRDRGRALDVLDAAAADLFAL
jgi:hypothetical protein